MKRTNKYQFRGALGSIVLAAGLFAGQGATAGPCDYRPSLLVGSGTAGALAAAGSGAAVAGAGAKAAGFYTLVHAGSGLTMLGSTAGGASAAGTVGIMGGTAGVLGTAGSILMAPATVAGAAAAGVGIGVYEGICYFWDERVTDYDEVMVRMELIAENANPESFRLLKHYDAGQPGPSIKVKNHADGSWDQYFVENLYIVNNVLMHRDWFRNTTIGNLGFVQQK